MNNKWLILSVGGILGTFLRYLVSSWVPEFAGTGFPYGTWIVNLTACLIVGVLAGMGSRGALRPNARLLLMTGFCGAYSTFSTWILETSNLADNGEMMRAGANLIGNLGAGLIFYRVGVLIGTMV